MEFAFPDEVSCCHGSTKNPHALAYVQELFDRFVKVASAGGMAGGPEFIAEMIQEGYERPDDDICREQLRIVTDNLRDFELNDLTQTLIQLYLGLYNYDRTIVPIIQNPSVSMKERQRVAILESEILGKATGSRLHAVRFVDNRIPCDCLVELRTRLTKAPRTLRCDLCGVDKPKAEMFRCSRCLMAEFCSRECQVNAWPAHKGLCKFVGKGEGSKKK